jgi:hypothetical protein
MARFLLEVPHGPDHVHCDRAARIFLATGSHFITHADFGCDDGVHKSWLTVEVDSKEEALRILPPGLRANAKVIPLSKFSLAGLGDLLRQHLPAQRAPRFAAA